MLKKVILTSAGHNNSNQIQQEKFIDSYKRISQPRQESRARQVVLFRP
jgi:hypothetical protein